MVSAPLPVGSSLPPTPDMHTDAVRASQHIYRRLLDAMSHPGYVWSIVRHPLLQDDIERGTDWLASIAMTLVDHEVSMHIVDSPAFTNLHDVIVRRTCVEIAPVSEADFILAEINNFDADLIGEMKIGTLDYPNDGATLILQIESLSSNDGPSMTLSGPGVNGSFSRPLGDLTVGVIATRNQATSGYPLGIDAIIVDRHGQIMAFPRTTRISISDRGQ